MGLSDGNDGFGGLFKEQKRGDLQVGLMVKLEDGVVRNSGATQTKRGR